MNVLCPAPALEAADVTARVTRGVVRQLIDWGYAPLTEVTLANRRRADVMGLSPSGEVVIVEVKSGLADFRADTKWRDYLPYCDGFSFAVAEDFPQVNLPGDVGLMVSDGFQAAMIRPWSGEKLHASRRKAVTLAFARAAALRVSASAGPACADQPHEGETG